MSDYIYYNNLTDDELLELVDGHYYSIGATGEEALEAVRGELSDWEEKHGVPQTRMTNIIERFEKLLTDNGSLDVRIGSNPFIRTARTRQIGRTARVIRKIVMIGRR